ncbi:NAC domain-containing protein 92-like [Cornus florida]|uniref:NAC domain-containing protein 92-like n=1 Tax=Cornus florida TaxID=4283 RepID=UPI00289C1249|nr:NAC domain-containing protein 92-like [Cornus florida]
MFIPPLGFRFVPTEDEILHYLRSKVMRESLPDGVILDINLYVNAPWDIFRKEDQWRHTSNKEFVIYFFTKLKKIGNQKRAIRRAGCGTWVGKTKPEEIYNRQKQLIGIKKMLTFEVDVKNECSIMPRGHWIMHEYSLSGVSLNGLEEESDGDYVVCKIKRDDSKYLRRAPKYALSNKENPNSKKKMMRYDDHCHHEASTSTTMTLKDHHHELQLPWPPFSSLPNNTSFSCDATTIPMSSSDNQPLLAYNDECARLFDLPNITINSCGTIRGLQQIDSFFDNFDATTTATSLMLPHDDIISTTMNSNQDL